MGINSQVENGLKLLTSCWPKPIGSRGSRSWILHARGRRTRASLATELATPISESAEHRQEFDCTQGMQLSLQHEFGAR